MKVTQIKDLMNTVTEEVLGKQGLVSEDLTNIVDIGKEIIDSEKVDNYVQKLVHHIGKVEFNIDKYEGNAKNVLMDSWEYGAILQRVHAEPFKAYENDSWNLQDGKDYSPNVFYQPDVTSQFFDNKVTFEIPVSFAEKQVKDSFSNVNQLNGFLTMLTNQVDTSMTIKLDSLIMRTINNYIGNVIDKKNGNTSINLLERYNKVTGKTLKAKDCLTDPDFLKHANFIINTYSDRITRISTLFNVGGKSRFTTEEQKNLILLSDFKKSSDVFLQSEVRHNELTGITNYDTVPYWQSSGTGYSFEDISSIDVKVNNGTKTGKEVKQSGIIGVLFDRNSLGVSNLDRRVTTNFNPKAEFYTNFYKADSGYFNDFNENFIVFYVADTEA